MNYHSLRKKTLYILQALKKKALLKQDLELALESVSAIAALYYSEGKLFRDNDLEAALTTISEMVKDRVNKGTNANIVLFYDGYGEDLRGIALIYLLGIAKAGKEIIYIVPSESKNKQPSIDRALEGYRFTKIYMDGELNYCQKIDFIINIYNTYSPQLAFSYILPWDVAGVCAFNCFLCKRIKIDLTDHTFWLGHNDFDFLIEFRQQGASVAYYLREVQEDKIKLLPYYPFIDESINFNGFEFDIENKKLIFSGGALYKTFSENCLYYKIVEHCLYSYPDTVFYYAGSGDFSQICKLKKSFPDRVFYSKERSDLYQVMQHCYFYLNTYPLFGGLMTQYALRSGRVPMALLTEGKKCDVIPNEEQYEFVFYDSQLFIEEIDKMIENEEYLHRKELLLKEAVIDEEAFNINLKMLLDYGNTSYKINLIPITAVNPEPNKNAIVEAIAKKNHKKLLKTFPVFFILRYLNKTWR